MSNPNKFPEAPLRIIKEFNGCLTLIKENLEEIIGCQKIESEQVAICSVIGVPKSGKTVLLNIFLQYLKSSQQNWIRPLNKQPLFGFHWLDVPGNLEQGIYMWPVPLTIKDSSDTEIKVFLMDSVKVKDGTANYGPMEGALCLLSSFMVDNQINLFKPDLLHLLHSLRDYSSNRGTTLPVCSCVTFLVRDFQPSSDLSCGWGKKAIHHVEEILRQIDHNNILFQEYQELNDRSACLLKAPVNGKMSTMEGVLNLDRELIEQLKNLCSKFFDTLPKKNFGGRDMLTYFSYVVEELCLFQNFQNPKSLPNFSNTNVLQINNDVENLMKQEEDVEMIDQSCPKQKLTIDEEQLILMKLPIPVNDFEIHKAKEKALVMHKVTEENKPSDILSSGITVSSKGAVQFAPVVSPSAYFPISTKSCHEGQWGISVDGNVMPKDAKAITVHSESNPFKENKGIELPKNETLHPLSSEEFDQKVQEKIKEIKENYQDAMREADEFELQSAHNHQIEIATKQLRQFLNPLNMSKYIDKTSNVKTLELTLKMEFNNEMKRRGNKRKNSSSLHSLEDGYDKQNCGAIFTRSSQGPENFKVQTSENELSPYLLNDQQDKSNKVDNDLPSNSSHALGLHPLQEPTQVMQTETDESRTTTSKFGLKLLSSIMGEFKELMGLNLSHQLLISNEDIIKFHSTSSKRVLQSLRETSKYQDLRFENFEKEVTDCLSTQVELYQNEAVKRNQVVQELIETSYANFTNRIEVAIDYWVLEFTTLDMKSKPNYASVHRNTLNQSLQSHLHIMSNMSFNQRKEFQSLLERSAEQHLNILKDLQNCFVVYAEYMNKRFAMFNCFSSEKFEKLHKIGIDSVYKKPSDNSTFDKLLLKGIENYKSQFEKRNKDISAAENRIAESALTPISNFYDKLMKKIVKGKMFIKDELEDLHQTMVDECLTAFKKACDFKPDQEILPYETRLKRMLDEQFQTHKEANNMKIQKIYGAIMKSVENHKKAYNEKMDTLLPKRGKSMDCTELQKCHSSTLQEQCKLLQMEIRNLDANIETSVDKYVQMLREKIIADWDVIQISNTKKLEKEEKERKEKARDEMKLKAEEELQKQDIESKRKKADGKKPTKTSATASAVVETPTTSTSGVNQASKSEPTEIDLPPIAIEFGLHQIKVGWIQNSKFEIIKNAWGENATLNQVAITKNNEVLVGSEVDSRPRSELKFAYKLEEILDNTKDQEKVFDCGENLFLRKEFLCGLILSRIKLDTEKQLRGKWTTAVITVPLWYTTNQRQATKDSAVIAGFSNVHLINETSAAALAFARSNGRFTNSTREKSVLVTVASNSHFDAAIYSYALGKVEMESSWGDLHCSHQNSSYLTKLKKVVDWVGKKLFTKSNNKTENTPSFKSIYNDMVAIQKNKIEETIFIQIENCKDQSEYFESLKNATSTFGKLYVDIPPIELIIKGASEFAESLRATSISMEKGLVKDKATYIIQRRCGRESTSIFPYQSLNSAEVHVSQTVGMKSCKGFVEIEEMSMDNVFPVGTILVNEGREVNIKFSLSNESLLRAEAFVTDGKGRKNKNAKTIIPSNFSRPTLGDLDKAKYASLVESLKRDEKKEAFEKSKKELQSLATAIEPKIQSVESMIGRDQLEKTVTAAFAVIQHPMSTHEMVLIKIEILTGLMSKYLKDM